MIIYIYIYLSLISSNNILYSGNIYWPSITCQKKKVKISSKVPHLVIILGIWRRTCNRILSIISTINKNSNKYYGGGCPLQIVCKVLIPQISILKLWERDQYLYQKYFNLFVLSTSLWFLSSVLGRPWWLGAKESEYSAGDCLRCRRHLFNC